MAEITKNRQDLLNEVAYSKLRVVGTGQPLEPEYANEIEKKIDPLLAQLSVDQICHVGNSEAIPAEWFDAIAGLLANLCAPLVGKQFSPDGQAYFEKSLKRLTSSRATYEVLEAEYF